MNSHLQACKIAPPRRQECTIKLTNLHYQGGKVTHFSSKQVHIFLVLFYLTLITTNDARKKHHLWQTPSLPHTFWVFPANILNFSCEPTGPFLRNHWTFPANSPNFSCELTEPFLPTQRTFPVDELKCRALNVNTASLRHRNAERSPNRWRAFGN